MTNHNFSWKNSYSGIGVKRGGKPLTGHIRLEMAQELVLDGFEFDEKVTVILQILALLLLFLIEVIPECPLVMPIGVILGADVPFFTSEFMKHAVLFPLERVNKKIFLTE